MIVCITDLLYKINLKYTKLKTLGTITNELTV